MKIIKNFFDENSRFTFISSVIMMIIAHGFCFTNIMYSHDSLAFYDVVGDDKVKFGRWLYPLFVQTRLVATPWLMGVLSVLYVSLAVVLVSKLFEFNKIQSFCVSVLFTTNITLTSLFCTFIFDADADCMALLLACFAVYAFRKFPKVLNIVVPIIALILCLALYQAYLCVTIGLYMLLLIYDSKDAQDWRDIQKLLFSGLKKLITLIIAMILYIPMMKIASRIYNIDLSNDYNGPEKLNSLGVIDVVFAVPGAYKSFIKELFYNINGYNTITRIGLDMLIFVMVLVSFGLFTLAHKHFKGVLMIVIPSLGLMPLALNAIYLISMGMIHQLMIFAFNIAFLLPIVLINITPDIELYNLNSGRILKSIKNCVMVISVGIIMILGFMNIIYDNGAYAYKKMIYDNTLLHAQTIWKDVNSISGYKEDETQVVFMGRFEESKAAYYGSVGNIYDKVLTGSVNSAITYDGRTSLFYYGVLGRKMNIVDNSSSVKKNKEYKEMPVYPENGYCKMIGDKVVVKMSE